MGKCMQIRHAYNIKENYACYVSGIRIWKEDVVAVLPDVSAVTSHEPRLTGPCLEQLQMFSIFV